MAILKKLRERLAYWVTPKEVIDLNIPQLQKNTKKMRGCQICFKRLGKATNLEGCSRCKVKFHRGCIRIYLEVNRACPICKDLFERDDPTKQTEPIVDSLNSKPSKKTKLASKRRGEREVAIQPPPDE